MTTPDETRFWQDLAEHLIPHHGVGAADLAVRLVDRFVSNPATREKVLCRVAYLVGMRPEEILRRAA